MKSILQQWVSDFRLAVRALMRSPGFTTVTVGTLGLAIGATAGMSGVVETVLLRPLPYGDVDQLVYTAASAPGSEMPEEFPVSGEFIVPYRQSPMIENVAGFDAFTATLRTPERADRILMSYPTRSVFETLGVRPILGRLPIAEDEDRAAMLSYDLWMTWFGGDPGVVGRSYEIAGEPREVIGVMGPEFWFPFEGTQLWIMGNLEPEAAEPGQFGRLLVARVAPGVTTEMLSNELTAISKRLPERYPDWDRYAALIEKHRAIVRPLDEQLLGSVARPLWVLLVAVGSVLVIACANVANLFMVRTEGRQRELAVRRAVGAGRAQLIRLQMTEALVIAAMAGIVAIGFAAAVLPVFLRAAPADIPRLSDVEVSGTMVFLTFCIAAASAMACGIVPAIRASSPDLSRLREAGRGATRRHRWGRDTLVVAQTALALVLLIGSGLLLRSFSRLSSVDPGYDTQDLFTFQIAPEEAFLTDGPSYAQFSMLFMDRLRALPGVEMVGLVENVPLNEGTSASTFRSDEMAADPTAGRRLQFTFAAGDYFEAMGIEVLAGEPFASRDLAATTGRVVISRAAADLLWTGEDPVGRQLQSQVGGEMSWTVVGVVEDVLQMDFRDAPAPLVYFPLIGPMPGSWAITSPAYVVRTARAEVIAPEVRELARELAPSAPMYRVFTMAGLVRDSMVPLSFTTLILGILSTLALILGAVGLYGVLSYSVAERTPEIGVRMALGASPGQVLRMVVLQGVRVVAAGTAIGIGVAMVSARYLQSLLYGVAPLDVETFAAMSAALVVVSLFASYVPARRALIVDPMDSLRAD